MEKMTRQSTMAQLYATPVGHDVLTRVCARPGLWEGGLLGSRKVGTALGLAEKKMGRGLTQTLLRLVNEHLDEVEGSAIDLPAAYKEEIFYQIYPRSFADGNGDGTGDLLGIRQKLPYLSRLGVTALWLSPIYASPMDDGGYDISDYRSIAPVYGTMEEFEALLAEAHAAGMKVIMDLVVNHTSDEHAWFAAASTDKNSPYHDYYIWRDGAPDTLPNNWTSFFSGPAWNYYPKVGQWALHIFSKKQMDLNWDNPALRKEIAQMVSWWLEKGVDGFRLDAINNISKDSFADGNAGVAEAVGIRGIEHYFYGAHLHDYLQELTADSFARYDALTVGETGGLGTEMTKQLIDVSRGELQLAFNFDHLYMPGAFRYTSKPYDLHYLKEYYLRWIGALPKSCRMSIFLNNHDNPRMLGRINDDPEYRVVLAKLLALLELTLPGTPFLYQGEELGMTNQPFASMDEIDDVETKGRFAELCKQSSPARAFADVQRGTRDHARRPMQWSAGENAGFGGRPWLPVGADFKTCNAAAEEKDPDSVLNAYRELIALRRGSKALVYGDFVQRYESHEDLFCYTRALENERYCVVANLTPDCRNKPRIPAEWQVVWAGCKEPADRLRPYEALLYRLVR